MIRPLLQDFAFLTDVSNAANHPATNYQHRANRDAALREPSAGFLDGHC